MEEEGSGKEALGREIDALNIQLGFVKAKINCFKHKNYVKLSLKRNRLKNWAMGQLSGLNQSRQMFRIHPIRELCLSQGEEGGAQLNVSDSLGFFRLCPLAVGSC